MRGCMDDAGMHLIHFEFDESDLYNSANTNSLELCKSVRSSRFHSNFSATVGHVGASGSLLVNVSDWSKILGNEYEQNRRRNIEVVKRNSVYHWDLNCHLLLLELEWKYSRTTTIARKQTIICVDKPHRCFKGRNLSRVRNAIWAKTGFQD
ncbi:uncharacterized protein LOC108327180 [Vigna angularis]|uniref:uncharacterized protein LOC108327180 n=1 Tax=Phaseolus angularis TaxID=3914 RepID=UPI0022B34A9E|nr:uncharacterized protein LOC108327180 [Vigna angularis]